MKEYADSIHDVINDIINIINTYFNKNIVYNNKIDDNNSLWIKYIVNILNEYIKNNEYKIIYDKYITYINQDIISELKLYDLWKINNRLKNDNYLYIHNNLNYENIFKCFNKYNIKNNNQCNNFYTCINCFCKYYHDINPIAYIAVINYIVLVKGINKNILKEIKELI